jgi:hypothetical protein
VIIILSLSAGLCDDGDNEILPVSKPATPRELKVKRSPIDPSTVDISWEYVSKADKYYVYRSSSPSGGERIDVTTSTYCTSYANVTNSNVYFKVSAVNDAGEGIASGWEKVDPVKLSAPEGVVVRRAGGIGNYYKIGIYWDDLRGATRYYVYWSTTGVGNGDRVGTPSISEYIYETRQKFNMWFRITGVNSAGEGESTRWYFISKDDY